MNKEPKKLSLIVTDIDNTLFDWVNYYVQSFMELLENTSKTIGVSIDTLASEAKDVFEKHGSIEYPFLVQELQSVNAHYGHDVDAMLNEAVAPARQVFLKKAESALSCYPDVSETLGEINSRYPGVPIVALTDAPRYVAMWKLNKLGLLGHFDAIYGLPDPKVPICSVQGRAKVEPEILIKHLEQYDFGFKGKIRVLPEEYEKPGTRGLKTVLMDYEMDEDPLLRSKVVWIGDNLRKDVGLGKRLGIKTAWASYGADISEELVKQLLKFSPEQSAHKNAALPIDDPNTPKPEFTLRSFSDILSFLEGMA